MNQYPISFLVGNPHLEALELQDIGAADCTPTLDADAFPDPDDYPSDDDWRRMEAENERFKRDAATVFGGDDPDPPAGALPPDARNYPVSAAKFTDDELSVGRAEA